jgi:hypothetical protein
MVCLCTQPTFDVGRLCTEDDDFSQQEQKMADGDEFYTMLAKSLYDYGMPDAVIAFAADVLRRHDEQWHSYRRLGVLHRRPREMQERIEAGREARQGSA